MERTKDYWTASSTLWVLHEAGATFVFHDEQAARHAIVEERRRGMHVEELQAVEAPSDDHAAFVQAVRDDPLNVHMHAAFNRATDGTYRTVSNEYLCAGTCIQTGDTENCERA